MKQKIFILALLAVALMGCSRKNGIYPNKTGWDVVMDGRTYEYRCETDAFYLYTDFDGADNYVINFYHHDGKGHRLEFRDGDLAVNMRFLCVNKDGRYVYLAEYPLFDYRMDGTKMIVFDCEGNKGFVAYPQDIQKPLQLLRKYARK